MSISNGVVAGSFDPFHVGHQALLQYAIDNCNHLDVILVAGENDKFKPLIRQASIHETFPFADMTVHIVDDIFTDDTTERSHELWARYTQAILGYTPHRVFASEPYGIGWAKAMGAQFQMYDQPRRNNPVSGTLCRENAFRVSNYLPPATKRYVLPRIVVLGAESTGTTTLAEALGAHYGTVVVPELGRLVSEEAVRAGGTNEDTTWDNDRFMLVSRGQDAMEERYATQANGLLVCDTDSLATAVWHEYYLEKNKRGVKTGVTDDYDTRIRLYRAFSQQAQKHALYILTWNDIPFQQDDLGTRTGEDLRDWMSKRFVQVLDNLSNSYPVFGATPYIIVKGSREERLKTAIKKIDEIVGA